MSKAACKCEAAATATATNALRKNSERFRTRRRDAAVAGHVHDAAVAAHTTCATDTQCEAQIGVASAIGGCGQRSRRTETTRAAAAANALGKNRRGCIADRRERTRAVDRDSVAVATGAALATD